MGSARRSGAGPTGPLLHALALLALLATAACATPSEPAPPPDRGDEPPLARAGDAEASGPEGSSGPAEAEGDPYAGTPLADDLYTDGDDEHDPYADDLALEEPDPYEDFNRTLFGFNQRVDQLVIEPVARAYGWVMPDVAERAVLRFFANLNSPSIFVNDVLQLEPKKAGVTLSRFVVNTTVGVAGFVDVADCMGLEGHHADFGQTLAVAGVPSGPYLVLPMAGPSTARDAFGSVVDLAFRPHTYFLGPTVVLLVGGGSGIVTREAYLEELEALRQSSVDFYATMRNIYFQRRAEQLGERGVEMEAVEEREAAEELHAPEKERGEAGAPDAREARQESSGDLEDSQGEAGLERAEEPEGAPDAESREGTTQPGDAPESADPAGTALPDTSLTAE